jgi:hypothetical protein
VRSALFALALMMGVSACASHSPPRLYGDAPALAPDVQLVPSQDGGFPTRVDVTLPQQAHLAVLHVVPGSPTRVVYPTDSLSETTSALPAGVHAVQSPFHTLRAADSARAARRPPPAPTSAAQAQRERDRYEQARMAESSGSGYLVAFTTQSPISWKELQRRVNGVSVPIGTNEALTVVLRLARASTTEDAPWAAVAVAVR